jgi:hypothetical protein
MLHAHVCPVDDGGKRITRVVGSLARRRASWRQPPGASRRGVRA